MSCREDERQTEEDDEECQEGECEGEEERRRTSGPQHDRADGSAGDDDVAEVQRQRKPFTISDMVATMNETMRSTVASDEGSDYPKVELCRRDVDGRTTGMDEADMKATDLRCKIGKAAEEVTLLDTPEEKIEWATARRLEGNRLFALGEYREAMDVYTTCLVAIDAGAGAGAGSSSPSSADDDGGEEAATGVQEDEDERRSQRARTEREIKLPVLLNLAACSMKLGQYRKTEEFCTVAIDETPTSLCGRGSVKAWYRRGKARMHLGDYDGAKADYEQALAVAKADEERRTIERDMKKLASLITAARENEQKCKRAMRTVFSDGAGTDGTDGTAALYDVGGRRTHSSLRAQPNRSVSESKPRVQEGESDSGGDGSMSTTIGEVGLVGWAVAIVSNCLRRLLPVTAASVQTHGRRNDGERSLSRAGKVKEN